MSRSVLLFVLGLLAAAFRPAGELHAQDGRSLCQVGDTVEVFIDRRWWAGEVREGPSADACGVAHGAFFGVVRVDWFPFDLVRPAGTDPANTGPTPTSPLCVIGDQVAIRVASGWHLGTVIAKHPTDGSCGVRHEAYGTPLDHAVEPENIGPPELARREAAPARPARPEAPQQPPAPPQRPAAPAPPEPAAPPEPPAAVPETLPAGRYVCSQGGLTSGGTLHWGYFDLSGDRGYRPFSGSGGTYRYDGEGSVRFQGGIFERYDWVGVARQRADDRVEITLVETADLDAYRAGRSRGGGSGIAVVCGYDGPR